MNNNESPSNNATNGLKYIFKLEKSRVCLPNRLFIQVLQV